MAAIDKKRVQPPPILYKYCNLETAKYIINDRRLKLSFLADFNDVMELAPTWNASGDFKYIDPQIITDEIKKISSKKNLSSQEQFYIAASVICRLYGRKFPERNNFSEQEQFLKDPSNFYILSELMRRQCLCTCFSENYNIDLMWSHYADKHSGICIGFKTTAFRNAEKFVKIAYRRKRITIKCDSNQLHGSHESAYTKGKQWKYEKEWRIVKAFEQSAFNFSEEQLFQFNIKRENDSFFLPFTDSAIQEIYFGIKSPSSIIEEIRNITPASVSFYRIIPDKCEFSLTKQKI